MEQDTARRRLPNRRLELTGAMEWHGGRSWLVSVGFDRDGAAREIFVDSTKPGGFIGVWVHDSCIALSMLLQRGGRLGDLRLSLAPRDDFGAAERSFIAALIEHAFAVEQAHGATIVEAYRHSDRRVADAAAAFAATPAAPS